MSEHPSVLSGTVCMTVVCIVNRLSEGIFLGISHSAAIDDSLEYDSILKNVYQNET